MNAEEPSAAKLKQAAVFAVPLDYERVLQLQWRRLGFSPVLCWGEQDVEALPEVDAALFVLSRTGVCSTMLQGTILTAVAALPQHVTRWVLLFDDVDIPLGFASLRDYPPAPAELSE